MMNRETKTFVQQHAKEDVRTLALQAKRYPEVDMPVAIRQIAGRQIAERKIPSWAACEEIMYPVHLSMEQCSSETTARYKQKIIANHPSNHRTLTDLTGGLGVDCSFMAECFEQVDYVEQQESLCLLAQHNFPQLGLDKIAVHQANGIEYLRKMEEVDWIFIDPARRDEHGNKTVSVADCEPNVAELEEELLKKSKQVMVKLSPMLDLSSVLQTLKHVQEVHVVSAQGECKELLLILGKEESKEKTIHCVNLTANSEQPFCFDKQHENEAKCTYTNQPLKYLYEPHASILKAGGYRSVAARFNLKKLHPNSHLYTSNEKIENFPGRSFQIVDSFGFGKKEIKRVMGSEQKANITIRNFPGTVAELRKRLKLSEGGDCYLFATTLNNEQKIILKTIKT